jgi:two-component system response regulator RegA
MRLLVVDDDDTFRERMMKSFTLRAVECVGANSGEEAIAVARVLVPDAAVIDMKMPGMGGLALIDALRAVAPAIRIVMLTGFGTITTAVEAMRRGAVEYLTKPADADDVLGALAGRLVGIDKPTADPPTLAEVEWEHMHRVLRDANGNVSEAARRLRMHRKSLQRKLERPPPRT